MPSRDWIFPSVLDSLIVSSLNAFLASQKSQSFDQVLSNRLAALSIEPNLSSESSGGQGSAQLLKTYIDTIIRTLKELTVSLETVENLAICTMSHFYHFKLISLGIGDETCIKSLSRLIETVLVFKCFPNMGDLGARLSKDLRLTIEGMLYLSLVADNLVDKDTFAVSVQDTLESINIIRLLLTQLFDYRFELAERYATSVFACFLTGAIQRENVFCSRASFCFF